MVKVLKSALAAGLILSLLPASAAFAQLQIYAYDGNFNEIPLESPSTPPPSQPAPTPTPPPPPPPPPEPPPTFVHIPTPPPPTFSPPVVVSTDVSRNIPPSSVIPPGLPPVSQGIEVIAADRFPQSKKNQNTDNILVRAKDNAVWERTSPHSVKLVSGMILVSVRRPSQLGVIETSEADLALSADGELLLSAENGVLHVLNASARGSGCKIKLRSPLFDHKAKHTFALKPGYEFVAGDKKLSRRDLRPQDGIARRRSQVFEDGRIALSEFSVDAMLRYCDLVANMNQKDSGVKERRILADMSKMAAVLNQVNGTQGFSYSKDESRLAGNGATVAQ